MNDVSQQHRKEFNREAAEDVAEVEEEDSLCAVLMPIVISF